MMKSLNLILNSIKFGFEHTSLHSLFDDSALRYPEQKSSVAYDITYWDTLSANLNEIQSVIYFSLLRWLGNDKDIGGKGFNAFDLAAIKFDFVNNSVESTTNNYALNTNFSCKYTNFLKYN